MPRLIFYVWLAGPPIHTSRLTLLNRLICPQCSFTSNADSHLPQMPKGKSSKPSASTPQAAPQAAPSWPMFKPPLPVIQLYPELHPATSNIILVSSFFPRSLCRDYVAYLRTLPMQTTPSKPKKGEAVRVNDRFQINDPGFARRLWDTTGLKELILEDESIKSLW